jgi:phosphoheptose isomerase
MDTGRFHCLTRLRKPVMDHYDILAGNCHSTIESLAMAVDALAEPMAIAAEMVSTALVQDGKVLACGAGPDAALAQLFTINMLGHFLQERPALPALALAGDGATIAAIAERDGPREMFARQIRALGHDSDLLLLVASAPAGDALLAALEAAAERNMSVIALSSGSDERLSRCLRAGDVEIPVHHAVPARALELHAVVIQNLSELIDHNLFGGYPGNTA